MLPPPPLSGNAQKKTFFFRRYSLMSIVPVLISPDVLRFELWTQNLLILSVQDKIAQLQLSDCCANSKTYLVTVQPCLPGLNQRIVCTEVSWRIFGESSTWCRSYHSQWDRRRASLQLAARWWHHSFQAFDALLLGDNLNCIYGIKLCFIFENCRNCTCRIK